MLIGTLVENLNQNSKMVIIIVSNKYELNNQLSLETLRLIRSLSANHEIIFFHHYNLLFDDVIQVQNMQINKIQIKPYSCFSFLKAQLKCKFIFYIDPDTSLKYKLPLKISNRFHFNIFTKANLNNLDTSNQVDYTIQMQDISKNPKALRLLLNQLNRRN